MIAQTNRGGISGNVTDTSGALVPGASITIINSGTNETRKLLASSRGSFIQENLDPVTYRIEVTAAGFQKAVIQDVKVDTSTIVATEVTVAANPAVVNTDAW